MADILLAMEKDLTLPVPEAVFPKRYIMINATENCRRLWEEIMDICFGEYQAGSFRYVCVNNAFYDDDRHYILLNEKNEPVGSSNSCQHTDDEGYVGNICVAPTYRGKGMALQLLYYGLREMKKRGLRTTFLCVGSDNYPAIKTCLKGGFVPLPRSAEDASYWNKIFDYFKLPVPGFDKTIRPKDDPHPPRPWPYQLSREKAAVANGDLFVHGQWNRFNMYEVDRNEYNKVEKLILTTDDEVHNRLNEMKTYDNGKIFIDSDVNPQAVLFINGQNNRYQYGNSKDGCFEDGLNLFIKEI